MTPTLIGRLQTRLAVSLIGGLPVALLLAVVAPPAQTRLHAALTNGAILFLTMGLGLAWEFGYHALQQWRVERDWPSGLALVVGVPELIAVRHVCEPMGIAPDMSLVRFGVVASLIWIASWASGQSLLRVLDPFWRFRGGRLI